MPHKRVRFGSDANRDIEDLIDWITDAAGAAIAHAYVELIRVRCNALAEFPRQGRLRQQRPELRSIPLRRSATILYQVTAREVVIRRVLSRGRDAERDVAALQ